MVCEAAGKGLPLGGLVDSEEEEQQGGGTRGVESFPIGETIDIVTRCPTLQRRAAMSNVTTFDVEEEEPVVGVGNEKVRALEGLPRNNTAVGFADGEIVDSLGRQDLGESSLIQIAIVRHLSCPFAD